MLDDATMKTLFTLNRLISFKIASAAGVSQITLSRGEYVYVFSAYFSGLKSAIAIPFLIKIFSFIGNEFTYCS